MGTSRAHHQWLRRGVVTLTLLMALTSCKHRRGPSVPEEWDPIGPDAGSVNLPALLHQTKSLRVLEFFEDGFVTTDTLTYRLDLFSSVLELERRFDPVPLTSDDAILLQRTGNFSAAQADFLQQLSQAPVRLLPRCRAYGAVDGGYGGRFLILVDRSGQEHRFGASDAACASSDHECSGACLSFDAMNKVFSTLGSVLPIPDKPQTVFSCAADSPLPCARAEFIVYGSWENTDLRADIRRALSQKLCSLAAFKLEPAPDGAWLVQDSSRTTIGTVRIDAKARSISCLTRNMVP